VKAVLVDERSDEILWSDYQRHEGKQADKLMELLRVLETTFPAVAEGRARIFATGSGAGALADPMGAKFVQEVNA
ncbi:MAG: hypothetical protein GWN71_00875, partial [Gammaproteobacteria bacterium]|nr:hypothetical protein [Gammaproteobacteria bacterium]